MINSQTVDLTIKNNQPIVDQITVLFALSIFKHTSIMLIVKKIRFII